jgi:hypothetical protein
MIAEGYAHEYTYNIPYKYQEEFKNAEKAARDAGKGLWATNTCAGDTTKAAITSQPSIQNTNPTTSTPAVQNSNATTPTTTQPTTNTNNDVTNPAVKKSSTSICHAKGTTYYDRTTNFTAYNSIDECIASGGRLPKR